jgi:hypothetical protein
MVITLFLTMITCSVQLTLNSNVEPSLRRGLVKSREHQQGYPGCDEQDEFSAGMTFWWSSGGGVEQ